MASFARFPLLGISLVSVFGLSLGLVTVFKLWHRQRQVSQVSQFRSTELGPIQKSPNNPKQEISVLINDPGIQQAWGLEAVQAPKAWQITQGSPQVVVAVIDTGCDIHHEDLHENIWQNPREIPGNNIDDDQNGFVDDVYGWSFVDNSPDISDNHGHGTHVAGIIAAMAGNNKGIAGVAPKVKIMCLKYYDPRKASDHLKNTINAIDYAIKMGAHIINYSGGGLEPSLEEKRVIEKALQKGILFVAAAGNEKSNSDLKPYYPADYGLPNIISVTAINPSKLVLPSSNYGVHTVDIAAPGYQILSLLPGNSYGYMTGTSQATAFVSGAAALVKSKYPDFTFEDIKNYILATGDAEPTLVEKTRSFRKLNLYKALTMLDQATTLLGAKMDPKSQVINPLEWPPQKDDTMNGIDTLFQLQPWLKSLQVPSKFQTGDSP